MSEHKMLCMGCMEPVESEGTCPNCGYNDSTSYHPSYLAPKTVLDDRYIVGKVLSFNGESCTYIGYDNVSNEKVFIKEYMPDALCSRTKQSPEIIVNQGSIVQYKNYMSEFIELNKTLSRLRTMSHIVAPLDMFSQNNTAYVILQYTEAITLKQYLFDNAGELTWEQVKKLFPPLLTTLGCIHNAGILHRGISLENILVTDRGELKLTGFAIPGIRTVNTDLAPELYTGYSAPEQYSAAQWEGTWTDVYAVAAVMYRLLSGCMPTEPMARIGKDSLMEPAKINPHVPANVSKVIIQAMRLNCDQRIRTVTDFVTKLFEQPEYMAAKHTPTQTIPIQVPKRTSKNKKSAKKGSSIGVIIGAVFLIAVVAAALLMLISMLLPDNTPDNPNQNNPSNSGGFVSDAPVVTDTPESSSEPVTSVTPQSTQPTSQTGNMFVMPSLIGKRYDSVISNDTWKERLEFEVIYDYSEEYDAGYIFEQDIEEGTNLYPIQKVKVSVSKGFASVEIPNFINEFGMNMTKSEYIAILDTLNIKYEIRYTETPHMPSDYVLGVFCPETLSEVGGKINVAEGNTLYVDVSVYSDITIVG
ncbi:MAG: protein kinase [Oscillospiraceae bacterium]|nr:protein kinase [Oscillospiraceae bacterium]